MDLGLNACGWGESGDQQLFQITEDSSQITEQIERGVESAIPKMVEAINGTILMKQNQCQCKQEMSVLIPLMIEAMKREFSAVEARFSKHLQEQAALFSAMVGEAMQKMSCYNPTSRSMPTESPVSEILQLCFVGNLPHSFHTLNNITTENGDPLTVELVDMSGLRVEVGPESLTKIRIVVLDGDFDVDNEEEDFNGKVASPRKDKGPLLKGDCDFLMMKGVATISNLSITDNSKSMRNGHFRLGAQVVKPPPGVAIKEAVSKAFKVKERRLQSNGKENNPSLDDSVCCLKHIGPKLANKLESAGVRTVKDFLQLFHTNPKKLRKVLGVTNYKWSEIVDNAKSCSLTKECYPYYDPINEINVLFDCVFNIASVTFKGQSSQPFDVLDDSHKELIENLRCDAYEKRMGLKTFISISPPSLRIEPSHTYIPHINAYHILATPEEPAQPEMTPNINCCTTRGMSSQPGECSEDIVQLYHELQNGGMLAEIFSECSASHMASSSNNSDATFAGHTADEFMPRSPRGRWKSVQFVVKFLLKEVAFRAPKRQKLG